MSYTQQYLISILNSAIFDKPPAYPSADIDWEYLYNKSVEQNVSGLLASALLRLPAEHLPPNAAMWEKSMLNTMYIMGRKFAEFERMSEIFANKGIKPIALKGIVLKDFYPVPELRTMGDFDVLTDNKDGMREVFKQEGYETLYDGVCITAKNENTRWEIFESLESEFKNNKVKYNSLMKENTVDWGLIRRPCDLYFTAHVIVHAAKHIMGTGAGVRQICDCIIALKAIGRDHAAIRQICAEQGVEKIFDYILACAAKDFGLETEYDASLDTDLFWEYLMTNGVFGKQISGNSMLFQIGRGDDSVPQWRKMYLPPAKLLSPTYNYAKNHPILLPAAWVHRFINAFFIRRDSFSAIVKGLDDAREFGNEREQWLKKLDLM